MAFAVLSNDKVTPTHYDADAFGSLGERLNRQALERCVLQFTSIRPLPKQQGSTY